MTYFGVVSKEQSNSTEFFFEKFLLLSISVRLHRITPVYLQLVSQAS